MGTMFVYPSPRHTGPAMTMATNTLAATMSPKIPSRRRACASTSGGMTVVGRVASADAVGGRGKIASRCAMRRN